VTAPFTIERLSTLHERKTFASGVDALDRYFLERVTQDIRRRLTTCFVAVDSTSQRVAGYYTIAATSIPLADLAPEIGKKLPRYPLVPAVRLGRLAVDAAYRGRRLGSAMLWDATARTIRSDISAFAVVVDAKDNAAVAFYEHHGFLPCASLPTSLYLPLAEAERWLRDP